MSLSWITMHIQFVSAHESGIILGSLGVSLSGAAPLKFQEKKPFFKKALFLKCPFSSKSDAALQF